jgi:hypothetical protein
LIVIVVGISDEVTEFKEYVPAPTGAPELVVIVISLG